ncbi:DUF1566 domain-containing protein [Bacteroides sp. 51]|uniref:Lcl domain-containing protein n=1 Tax=Bacteroides sp. 51 TaxID=2302938 RepID=UPI0013D2EF17|nr:DUF1566 domain-containing protein [Bacteroides sp. 51]
MNIKRIIFSVVMIVINLVGISAQVAPWWWIYPNKLPIGNNFDYVPCMGEGKSETDARRKAEAESYRMFTAKNKHVEFSEITYIEIEEHGLKATLPEYATNYTFVCNPEPEKISDSHYKVYILYAWRRNFNKPVNFGEVDTKICDELERQLDFVELKDSKISVQKNDIVSSKLYYEDAKLLCEGSTVGGYTDWRLPTINELSFMYLNKNKFDVSLFSNRNVSARGFNPPIYWSSTEVSLPRSVKKNKTSYKDEPGYKLMIMSDGRITDSNQWANGYNYCRCVRTLP